MNKKRTFLFVWAKKEKYSEPIKRHNVITVRNATGDIGSDAGYATNCFCKQFGSLSKIDILCIQELNEKGLPIGEPITPMEQNNIVPIKK